MYACHLLSELSWLAEGSSCARLESVLELCGGKVEGKWEEGAEGPLVLMFRDGESGFGVEDVDEAERNRTEALFETDSEQSLRKMAADTMHYNRKYTLNK